jgi:hypothetical protein
VVLNERRATPHGLISGATRRDGAIFPQTCVSAHVCSVTTRHSRCLVLRKNGLRRDDHTGVNRPLYNGCARKHCNRSGFRSWLIITLCSHKFSNWFRDMHSSPWFGNTIRAEVYARWPAGCSLSARGCPSSPAARACAT